MSAPMVRALLAGTKTQTRRVMKPQPPEDCRLLVESIFPTKVDKHGEESPGDERFGVTTYDGDWCLPCPHGAPGERLWVRERWGEFRRRPGEPVYYADDPLALGASNPWRPSIFMPRRFSRITLEITGVRVERLQDISEADAIAEGIESLPCDDVRAFRDYLDGGERSGMYSFQTTDARKSYRSLWESINGAGSWDANPWVWIVEFRRA